MNKLFTYGILVVALSSCVTRQAVYTTSNEKTVNSAFQDADTTSTSISGISWRTYFRDVFLRQHIDTALRNNPDVLMTLARIQQSAAWARKEKLSITPGIDGVAGAGVIRFGDYTVDGVGNFDTNLSDNITEDQRIPTPTPDLLAGISTQWEAGLWGRYKHRKRAALARFAASEEGRRMVQSQLISQVATLYYTLLALDNELRVVGRNRTIQQEALAIVRIQKESGQLTELAVKQFEAQLLELTALELQLRQRVVEAENQLCALIGVTSRTLARSPDISEDDIPTLSNTGGVAQWMRTRPDIVEAAAQLTASGHDAQVAYAEFFPDLRINLFMGLNSFAAPVFFQFPASLAYTAMGGLAAPLLNRNDLKYGYAQATAGNKIAFEQYRKTMLTALAEVNTSRRGVENWRAITALKRQEAETLTQAISVANDLFVNGFANYMEVLLVQRNRLHAEIQVAESILQLYLANIQLYKSLGGGVN